MFKKHKPARWVYVSFVNWEYDDEEEYEMF